ncbi:hypothetical protein [Desulfoferrobacter suflitae]|uniref:hypothetical protein n=1 Tax=Desulfoferrobacter suflitae TaxID=2865782 RepID=UPI0021648C84|nr:hypothetical protein [Desulfoferrobacter suflitae]MCK8601958.1 hypothetical protein [Desulfoferrobacter suflitae]
MNGTGWSIAFFGEKESPRRCKAVARCVQKALIENAIQTGIDSFHMDASAAALAVQGWIERSETHRQFLEKM